MNSGPRRNRSWRNAIHGRVGNGGIISAGRVAGASRSCRDRFFPPLSMFCAPAASGRRSRRALGAAVPSVRTFSGGGVTDFLCGCGGRAWRNTTRWRALPGRGRLSTALWAKRPLPIRRVRVLYFNNLLKSGRHGAVCGRQYRSWFSSAVGPTAGRTYRINVDATGQSVTHPG